MKTAKLLFTLILIVMVFVSLCASAGAMDSGFILEEYPEEHIQGFLSNIDIHLIDEEPKNWKVMCYAVREDGTFAVGSQIAETEYVSVFDKYGVFQYGYEFDCSSYFNIGWDKDEEIIIYLGRSYLAASFDENCNCTGVKRISKVSENYRYWNTIKKEIQKVGDDTYRMHNGKLTKTDAEGNESVLYNGSKGHVTFNVILLVIAVGALGGGGVAAYFGIRDYIERNKKE